MSDIWDEMPEKNDEEYMGLLLKFTTLNRCYHNLNIQYEIAKVKAVKWDKAYSGVYDDEMPFTPERISLVMNYVNDHHPDFDTPKEFEDMITEYIEWEGELGDAEDKLEAIKTWIAEMPKPPSLYLEAIPYWKKVYEEFVEAYNRDQENIKKILEAEE